MVDRRNIDPKEQPRRLAHRKGAKRLAATEWPREPGLGGWSETETACLLGLDDYSRVFEFTAAAGSVDGYTVTFEFRPGALTYEAGQDTEVVLWRWGGKNGEPFVCGLWRVLADAAVPDIEIAFRFQDGATTQEMVWSPSIPTADTVWYVAMTLASGTSGGASLRSGDGRGGTITTRASIATLATTFCATSGDDFEVESDGLHSDLTVLGARSRANVAGESGTVDAAKGARPVISNFVIYTKALNDTELADVLGQEV